MGFENIRSKFPIFEQKIKGKPLTYLDSANSSQKPKTVIDEMSRFYETEFSNVGRSVHTLAVKATNKFEETRDIVQSYINAKHREEIIFTKGATEAINLVASTYGEKFIKAGDEILVTELEHHSNYVPWHYLRKKRGAVIKFASVNENGEIEKLQVSEKGPGDFVTASDKRVEKIIIGELEKSEYSFLTEETGLIEGKHKDKRWIIDPIDGTFNFLNSLPHFAISIAYEENSEKIHRRIS